MKRIALLLPLLLTLAACDTVGDGISDGWHGVSNTWNNVWDGNGEAAPSKLPPASGATNTTGCPQVAVVRDLSIYQNPPAATEKTLALSARMGHIRGGCSANAGGVSIDHMVDFVVTRGPNSSSTRANLPFFVSVLNAKDEVISKKVYEVPVDFENNARETRISSPIQEQFQIKPGEDGATYRVLVGFHLNPQQIDANTRFFSQLPATAR